MSCRPAVSSHSLGRAWIHDIRSKLDQAAHFGFAIELFYEDLEYVARDLPGGLTWRNRLIAAHQIRFYCDERHVDIVCLQPFMNYEGLRDRKKHVERKEEMKLWLQLATALHTTIISIPSSFLSKDVISGDRSLIVNDLRKLADLAAPAGIRLAFESLAWGTYVNTWEDSWEIVQQVDRPNFGICLDTFNIAAKVYGDPSAPSRRTANAEQDIKMSLERLVRSIDVTKVFYVQVVDGEYLQRPLAEGHELYNPDHSSARMSWSRSCRLFYGEQAKGGYLPIHQIMKAILVDLGFRGWISSEMFNRSLANPRSSVPAEHARRAFESWTKLVRDFGSRQNTMVCFQALKQSEGFEQLTRAQF